MSTVGRFPLQLWAGVRKLRPSESSKVLVCDEAFRALPCSRPVRSDEPREVKPLNPHWPLGLAVLPSGAGRAPGCRCVPGEPEPLAHHLLGKRASGSHFI